MRSALALGRQAVVLKLGVLEIARIHEQALVTLKLNSRGRRNQRAGKFFAEAIAPVVGTRRAARRCNIELNRSKKALNRCLAERAAAKRRLQLGTLRRKNAEAALNKIRGHFARLLKDSLRLRARLRQLTDRVMTAREEDRRKISGELQNGIAQSLLGIHIRLASLRRQAWIGSARFNNKIVNAQRSVARSVKSVRGVTRKHTPP